MHTTDVKGRIEHFIAMAQLLERVDAHPSLIGALQFQKLAGVVQSMLRTEIPDDALRAVLRACPATAQLYENLHYDRSGLSQSPLDRAVESELRAAEAIDHARRRPAAQP